MDLATGKSELITGAYDREVGDSEFQWLDNDRILAINKDYGNANIIEINVKTKNVSPWWGGQRVVRTFALAPKANRLLAIASDFITPVEIYDVSERGKATALTSFHKPLTDELLLTRPEKISYPGPGGQTIHGYLHKPPNFDPSKTYPMITSVHGGPYDWWSSAYDEELQAMAAAGYLILYLNPRGSTSYGQDLSSALAVGWPGPEYDDIMAGIDMLLSRPYIDPKKLAIVGSSAGGILTDWAITHTDRFAAAASISDIADFAAYWFVGNQPFLDDPASRPWLDEELKNSSAVTFIDKVKTPTLFVAGTRDFRTPASAGATMMFRILQLLRVPTAFIQFEGGGHSIFNNRDGRHSSLNTHYQLRWMDLHLKGKPAPEFDVKPVS